MHCPRASEPRSSWRTSAGRRARKWRSWRGSRWVRPRRGFARRSSDCGRRWRSSMKCDDVLLLLPDDALGTLDESDRRQVRAHLRGCAACRAEAARLDEGLTSFASSLEAEAPPELEDRVMAVLQEEWAEAEAGSGSGRHGWVRWLSVAAVIVALAGAVAWGSVSQVRASRFSEDAT